MIRNTGYLKKHSKPPYDLKRQLIVIFLLLYLIKGSEGQTEFLKSDDTIVGWYTLIPSQYSITVHLDDTENFEIVNIVCKNPRNTDDAFKGDPTMTCDGLDPCTEYFVTVTSKSLPDGKIEDLQFTTTTLYAEPQTTVLAPDVGFDTIDLTWEVKDSSCVSNFEIEVKSSEKFYQWTTPNDQHNLHMNNLDACSDQNIQLRTYDNNKILISNHSLSAITTYAEPGNVTVKFEDYENAQIKVSWEQPMHKNCIQYYHLKWSIVGCEATTATTAIAATTALASLDKDVVGGSGETNVESDDSCEWSTQITDFSATEYIINNLQGCESYSFDMYINDQETSHCENCREEGFTSPEQVPGTVIADSPIVNPTNMTLHWSPPEVNHKCVNFYRIYMVGPIQKTEAERDPNETEDTTVTFLDLDPCGRYNFTVIPVSLNGTEGLPLSLTVDTTEARPSAVQNVQIDHSPNKISITWDEPDFGDLCVTSYRVSVDKADNAPVSVFEKQTTFKRVEVDNLFSCQAYQVQIIAATVDMDGDLLRIETKAMPTKLTQPKLDQRVVSYDRMELNAQKTDSENNCDAILARFYCVSTNNSPDAPIKTAEQYVVIDFLTIKAVMAPLSPVTEYRCTVSLLNVAGWSPEKSIIASTELYFPEVPNSVNLKSITNSSATFQWMAPTHTNGNIKLYRLYFDRVDAAYYIPPDCSATIFNPIDPVTTLAEQSFINLEPFIKYSVQVAAVNDYGVGEYTRPYITRTKPWISEPVRRLKVVPEGPYEVADEYLANVIVSWYVPCKSNGIIETFELEFVGERSNHKVEKFTRSILPKYSEDGEMVHNETNLRPEYNYRVTVSVKTKDVNDISPIMHAEFESPSGIPQKLDDSVVDRMRVDPFKAYNPSKSAVVCFPADILETEAGTILYAALLLSQKGCSPDPPLVYGALDSNSAWVLSRTWSQVNEENSTCIPQYQTTPLRWKPHMHVIATDDAKGACNKDEVEFMIGSDKCGGTMIEYCNGPLKPDTEYNLILRLYTKSGYSDATLLDFKTDSIIKLTVIVASVSGCFGVAIAGGLSYLYIKKRLLSQRLSLNGFEDLFGDSLVKNFANHFREISKMEKLSREFRELNVVANDLSHSASEMGCNKNRYTDIYPYDKNRVILDIDADGSDYINASFIDGFKRKKEYIATQGPKQESTMDFWRMVLQHNVRVIVMVTQFREGGVVKCHEYFPFKSKGINVTVRKKEFFSLYDRTELIVRHERYGMKQKVVHFYFKKWPDHGVPADPNHLITFIRKVKAERIPNHSPIVVHCSAGVGRTGTFIGVDIIMQRLKGESKINVFETVKKLRFQRMKMVQTMTQYSFLYKCAYELVKHKTDKGKPAYAKGKKTVSFDDVINLNATKMLQSAYGHIVSNVSVRCGGSEVSSINDEIDVESACSDTNRQPRSFLQSFDRTAYNGSRSGSELSSINEHDGSDTDSFKTLPSCYSAHYQPNSITSNNARNVGDQETIEEQVTNTNDPEKNDSPHSKTLNNVRNMSNQEYIEEQVTNRNNSKKNESPHSNTLNNGRNTSNQESIEEQVTNRNHSKKNESPPSITLNNVRNTFDQESIEEQQTNTHSSENNERPHSITSNIVRDTFDRIVIKPMRTMRRKVRKIINEI